jgi:hypothetical protein
MFQLIRDFVVLKELPVWPGDGWEKGTSNGSWENQASGFQDYTLAPAMPDGYMLTPTCACKPQAECSPRASVCIVFRVMTACAAPLPYFTATGSSGSASTPILTHAVLADAGVSAICSGWCGQQPAPGECKKV